MKEKKKKFQRERERERENLDYEKFFQILFSKWMARQWGREKEWKQGREREKRTVKGKEKKNARERKSRLYKVFPDTFFPSEHSNIFVERERR